MGLLDDAIREHLELKRRSGADASDIARAEHEALAPPPADGSELYGQYPALHDGEWVEDGAAANEHGDAPRAEPDDGLAGMGQDTAELDMESVLAEQHGPPGHPPTEPPQTAAPVAAAPAQSDPAWVAQPQEGDPPGEATRAEPIPGQERMSFE